MNQRLYCLLWLLGTALVFLAGCKTSQSSLAKGDNSLLWKIEGNGLKAPSYLLGTIHILPKNDFFLTEAMQKALQGTEQIVLELDMDDPQMASDLLKNATMKDGNTLDKLLSKSDYQKLDSLIKKGTGVSAAIFNQWQPILLSSLVFKEMVANEFASYESNLINRAKAENKEIKGLESVQEQTQALTSIPYAQQAQYLHELITNFDKQQRLFTKMVDLYKAQNINGLLEYIVEQSGGIDFSTVLINQRNQAWISRIGNLAKEKPSFFAVGAGHLPGKKGVLTLLRKAGYKVEPVF